MSTIFERILKLLADQDITPLVHEHAEVRTIDQARLRAAHLMENLVKTIAFEAEPGPRLMLASVAHDAQVDYKLLSALLGCNRRGEWSTCLLSPALAPSRGRGRKTTGSLVPSPP